MKRIVLLLTVALVMAAMIAASAMPAFAVNEHALKACEVAADQGVEHIPFCAD